MRQRVLIAMALAGNPSLLVADEPTTALDVTVQAQVLALIAGLVAEKGLALMLISHDLGVVAASCARVAVMYAGTIVEEAPTGELLADPRHPYAQGLIAAVNDLSVKVPIVIRMEGTNVEQGKAMLAASGLNFTNAASMGEAADKIVALSK